MKTYQLSMEDEIHTKLKQYSAEINESIKEFLQQNSKSISVKCCYNRLIEFKDKILPDSFNLNLSTVSNEICTSTDLFDEIVCTVLLILKAHIGKGFVIYTDFSDNWEKSFKKIKTLGIEPISKIVYNEKYKRFN